MTPDTGHAFVDLHCHTSRQLRQPGGSARGGPRRARPRADPSRDHRPRPDRRRAARPRRCPGRPDRDRRRGDQDPRWRPDRRLPRRGRAAGHAGDRDDRGDPGAGRTRRGAASLRPPPRVGRQGRGARGARGAGRARRLGRDLQRARPRRVGQREGRDVRPRARPARDVGERRPLHARGRRRLHGAHRRPVHGRGPAGGPVERPDRRRSGHVLRAAADADGQARPACARQRPGRRHGRRPRGPSRGSASHDRRATGPSVDGGRARLDPTLGADAGPQPRDGPRRPAARPRASDASDRDAVEQLSLGRRLRQPRTIISLVVPLLLLVLLARTLPGFDLERTPRHHRRGEPAAAPGRVPRSTTWASRSAAGAGRCCSAAAATSSARATATEIIFISGSSTASCRPSSATSTGRTCSRSTRPCRSAGPSGPSSSSASSTCSRSRSSAWPPASSSFRDGLPPIVQIVFALGIGVVIVLAAGLLTLRNFGRRIILRLPLPHRVVELYDRFEEGVFGAVGAPRQMPILVVLTGLIWATEAMRLFLVVEALGFPGVHLGISGAFFVALRRLAPHRRAPHAGRPGHRRDRRRGHPDRSSTACPPRGAWRSCSWIGRSACSRSSCSGASRTCCRRSGGAAACAFPRPRRPLPAPSRAAAWRRDSRPHGSASSGDGTQGPTRGHPHRHGPHRTSPSRAPSGAGIRYQRVIQGPGP